MTSQFWKWLSRANARTALLAAMIALAAVLGYWVWREVEPGPMTTAFPGRQPAPEGGLTNRVELLAFLQAQQKNGEKAMNNPFFRRPVRKPEFNPPRHSLNKPDPFPGARPQTKPEPRPELNPPPKQAPARPPPPPPARLIPVLFRGIMTRPDGTAMALIENQETRKQRFYEVGQPFMGRTVEQLANESVTLKKADGSEVVLPRGAVVKVRED